MIPSALEQRGEFSAAIELRKMFPGIADESGSGVCVHHGQLKASSAPKDAAPQAAIKSDSVG
jgi:hypothetical protein